MIMINLQSAIEPPSEPDWEAELASRGLEASNKLIQVLSANPFAAPSLTRESL
jgi:hypothetical protein